MSDTDISGESTSKESVSKEILELVKNESLPNVDLNKIVLSECESEIRNFVDRYPIDSTEEIQVTKHKQRLLPRYKQKRFYHEKKPKEPSRLKSAEIPKHEAGKESSDLRAASAMHKLPDEAKSVLDKYLINIDGSYKVKLAIHSNRTIEMLKRDDKDKGQEMAPVPVNKMEEFRKNILKVGSKPAKTMHKTHDVIRILQAVERKRQKKYPKYDKIRKPTLVEYLRHTTDGGPPRVHYFTHGRQIDEYIDVTKLKNPFQLIEYTLGRGREILSLRCEKRKSPGYLSDTYTSSLQASKLCRIHIPYVEEKALGKLDITPDFWTIVEGRAIRNRLNRKELKHFLEDNLRKTLTTAFLCEEESRCQVKHRIDCSLLPPLEDELFHMETFKAFMNEKYCNCLHTVAYAEEITHIRTQILSINKELEDKLELVSGDLVDIYDLRGRIKWCKDVTYRLSPKIWKYDYSLENEKFKSPFSSKIFQLMKIFNKKKQTGLKYIDRLIHKVVKQLIQDINEFGPPLMYFSKPLEFQTIIKNAEMENLQYNVRALDLTPQISKLKYMINKLSTYFDGYLNRLSSIRNIFYRLYTRCKEKSNYYNKKLTVYTTRDSYEAIVEPSRENVVMIRLLIEETYNAIVKNPSGVKTCLGFMAEIEAVFFSLWFNIELYYVNYKGIMDKAVDTVLKREAIRTVGAERARLDRNIAYKLLQRVKEAIRPYRGSVKFKELKFRSIDHIDLSDEDDILDAPVDISRKPKPLSFDDVHAIHCSKAFREEIKRKRFEYVHDMINIPQTPLELYDDNSLYNYAFESDKESAVDYEGIVELDTPSEHTVITGQSSSISELKENTFMEQYIDTARRDTYFMRTWDADLLNQNEIDEDENMEEQHQQEEDEAKEN